MSNRLDTSPSRVKLLVDTSFLLPAMGIETEKEVFESIECFHLAEVYYLNVSLLEAMWKIIKVIPFDKVDRVIEGIRAIMETYREATPPPRAYIDAYRLYHEGHKDYIDNLLYSTSLRLNLFFLTIDRCFIEFLERRNHPVHNIVTPDEIKRMLG